MLFAYNTQLKPGNYKISEMNRIAKPGFNLGGKHRHNKVRHNGDVEWDKGKITIIHKKILFQQPQSKLVKTHKRGQKQQKKKDAERNLEKIKRKKERKADQEAMKKQRVRQAQLVDLDESFKSKILEELKEVENIDQWKLE